MTCMHLPPSLVPALRALGVGLVCLLGFLLVPGGSALAAAGDTGLCSDGVTTYADLGPWPGGHLPDPPSDPVAGTWDYGVFDSSDSDATACATGGLSFVEINSAGTEVMRTGADPAPAGELFSFSGGDSGTLPPPPAGWVAPSPSPSPSSSSSGSPSPSPSPTGSPSPSPTSSVSPFSGGTSSDPLYVEVVPNQWIPFLWFAGSGLLIAVAWFVYTFSRKLRRIGGG